MSCQKVTTTLTCLTIALLTSALVVVFVAETRSFQHRAEQRWFNDDIRATRQRVWDLEKNYPGGAVPTDITLELIRLKAELEMMYKHLEIGK